MPVLLSGAPGAESVPRAQAYSALDLGGPRSSELVGIPKNRETRGGGPESHEFHGAASFGRGPLIRIRGTSVVRGYSGCDHPPHNSTPLTRHFHAFRTSVSSYCSAAIFRNAAGYTEGGHA